MATNPSNGKPEGGGGGGGREEEIAEGGGGDGVRGVKNLGEKGRGKSPDRGGTWDGAKAAGWQKWRGPQERGTGGGRGGVGGGGRGRERDYLELWSAVGG